MRTIKKINSRFERYMVIGESDIYRKFSKQFDCLLDAREVSKDKESFDKIYVSDYDFEIQLESFRTSETNMAKFCVGYTGIGKTTSIRHSFDLGVSKKPYINTHKKEIVFPTFLDGYQVKDIERFDIAARIATVCTELEEKHPELKIMLKTESGINEFYDFFRKHTGFALENINPIDAMEMDECQLIREKLRSAYEKNPFEYQANRLKFYIMKKYDMYERLVIILDDIESLPECYQLQTIEQFLKLHDCMQNTDIDKKFNYHVNLLISVRPHTYRIWNDNRNIETFVLSEPAILKKHAVDLDDLFEKRFEYYTDKVAQSIGNPDTWEDCYRELQSMNRAFEGKYKDMITNLCFMNVREALAAYARVFSNRFWVQKNKPKEDVFTIVRPEYFFNNINVIRALACNEESVYWGDSNSIIPNIFYTTEDEDYSIICMLIIVYFKRKRHGEVYGLNAEKLETVYEEWKNIFGEEILKKFRCALEFLFENKVLRKSIKDRDDIMTLDKKESLKGDSKLYISPRGNEIFEMLSRDSVLFEMLRESAWRDYENRNYIDATSSELMKEGQQNLIFIELLEYTDYLSETEDDVLSMVKLLKTQGLYKQAFGDIPISQTILNGIKKSLDYSGYSQDEVISVKYKNVKNKVSKLMRF